MQQVDVLEWKCWEIEQHEEAKPAQKRQLGPADQQGQAPARSEEQYARNNQGERTKHQKTIENKGLSIFNR